MLLLSNRPNTSSTTTTTTTTTTAPMTCQPRCPSFPCERDVIFELIKTYKFELKFLTFPAGFLYARRKIPERLEKLCFCTLAAKMCFIFHAVPPELGTLRETCGKLYFFAKVQVISKPHSFDYLIKKTVCRILSKMRPPRAVIWA